MGDSIAEKLVPWYRAHRRDLAFRGTRDPYAILVSEVLLQRTRVVSGLPYYGRFMARFPAVSHLAAASEEDVLKAWEGLGFYGRARNLRRAAKAVVADHGGSLPRTFAALRDLPGVGDYTAGAVASIAFGERVPAVDGNASRVLSRVFRLHGDPTRGAPRRRLVAIAAGLVPVADPGTYNQALMELGSTVCRPQAPRCPTCPLRELCGAYADGDPESYPESRPRSRVPTERVAFALCEREGEVLLVRRPAGGLLAGLWALPGGELGTGVSEEESLRAVLRMLGLSARFDGVAGSVAHTFSHRKWVGAVYSMKVATSRPLPEDAVWAGPDELRRLPLVPFHRRFLEGRSVTIPDTRRGEPF